MRNIYKVFVFVLLGVLLAGCSTNVPAEMRARMVDTNDIPQDWVIFKESASEDWGGELYNIAFAYGNESESPALEHQLIIYADAASAIAGFEEYQAYIFATGWEQTDQVPFRPASPDDLFEVRCSTQEIDHVMTDICFVLQQHENYVSALGYQMGGSLTFEVLDSILKTIDVKLNMP